MGGWEKVHQDLWNAFSFLHFPQAPGFPTCGLSFLSHLLSG